MVYLGLARSCLQQLLYVLLQHWAKQGGASAAQATATAVSESFIERDSADKRTTTQENNMKKTKLVSLMMPSRGRTEKLDESIKSIVETASDLGCIELLIRADSDDKKTLEHVNENIIGKTGLDVKLLVGDRDNGYVDLHLFYNQLAAALCGRFVTVWRNDDAKMMTKDWDSDIKQHDDGKLCFINSYVQDSRIGKHNRDYFPTTHHTYHETLGYYSPQVHVDSYAYSVFEIAWNVVGKDELYRKCTFAVKHEVIELQAQHDPTAVQGREHWK